MLVTRDRVRTTPSHHHAGEMDRPFSAYYGTGQSVIATTALVCKSRVLADAVV
jgi:hypothetical protein